MKYVHGGALLVHWEKDCVEWENDGRVEVHKHTTSTLTNRFVNVSTSYSSVVADFCCDSFGKLTKLNLELQV